MLDSRKIHLILCLLEIFCSNLFFGKSVWGCRKNLIGSLGFDIYLLAIG